MFPWFLAVAAAADCGFSATEAELHTTMDAAEAAYADLDVAGFRTANDELRLAFPCIATAVSPETAARVARLRALALATAGDQEGAVQALTAAKELQPNYTFPETLLPTGHQLRTAYDGVEVREVARTRLPRPQGVTVLLDGEDDLWRPTHRPAVFQLQRDGHVHDTQLLWPGDPAPDYPKVPVTRNRLLWTAAGLGVGALGMYGGAWASRGGLETAEGADQLQSVQRRTNLLTGISFGLAIGAGASTTAALLVGDRG